MVPATVASLRERFVSLARRLGRGNGDPGRAAGALIVAWEEPARRYHGLDHLRDCLARLDEASSPSGERDLVEAALWFHDAVYDPHAGDNEERSAALAVGVLGGLGVRPAQHEEVARLVLLTRHDAPPRPDDSAGRLLCDIDLSVLGRSPEEFAEYDRQIRAEYAWVPEGVYRDERARVLAALLRRRPLFQTERFQRRYEAAARANLEQALAALK